MDKYQSHTRGSAGLDMGSRVLRVLIELQLVVFWYTSVLQKLLDHVNEKR